MTWYGISVEGLTDQLELASAYWRQTNNIFEAYEEMLKEEHLLPGTYSKKLIIEETEDKLQYIITDHRIKLDDGQYLDWLITITKMK